MGEKENSERLRELEVLEALVENPEARQADLATRLGVAVGTVNWLLKRLVSKGYVKVKRIGRWRWRYLLTPQGFAEKTRLTQQYLQYSMRLYRDTRQEARRLLKELKERGYDKVRIEGDPKNDLVDVCRLTCLEEGVEQANTEEESAPLLLVDGRELSLDWPSESEVASQKSGVEISGSKRHGADKTV
ncbi:winged helix-turn-helix transcriptional regulator [Candidatus Bipolaricaulota bacterium]|nr:winged helix-turn-helix transcriptional regulator [Candidatus Bipolaricaulota bacterium]